jgi:hypothetical protein
VKVVRVNLEQAKIDFTLVEPSSRPSPKGEGAFAPSPLGEGRGEGRKKKKK